MIQEEDSIFSPKNFEIVVAFSLLHEKYWTEQQNKPKTTKPVIIPIATNMSTHGADNLTWYKCGLLLEVKKNFPP